MTDSWTYEVCPECGADNWIDLGDSADLTVPDIEGCECHNCGRVWMLEGSEGEVEVQDAFVEVGKEHPL